jgi:adenylyltransferase/sulfurtransferase
MNPFEITPEELHRRLECDGVGLVLLDVRQPEEHDYCRLPDSLLIPLNELPWRASELSLENEIVVYCHHGVRSLTAVHYLTRLGFERVKSLAGGIDAWSKMIDPSLPRY